jgi:hypothetical protein
MPQLHTKAKDTIYTEILTWIHTKIITKFSTVTTLMDGDLQATPSKEDERSYQPTHIHTSKNTHRSLAPETTKYNHTLYEHKHNDHHPHPGIRIPNGPNT